MINPHESDVAVLGLELTIPGSAVIDAVDCDTEPGEMFGLCKVVMAGSAIISVYDRYHYIIGTNANFSPVVILYLSLTQSYYVFSYLLKIL